MTRLSFNSLRFITIMVDLFFLHFNIICRRLQYLTITFGSLLGDFLLEHVY